MDIWSETIYDESSSSRRAFFAFGWSSEQSWSGIGRKIDSTSADDSNWRQRRAPDGGGEAFLFDDCGRVFLGAGGHSVIGGILWSDDVGVLNPSSSSATIRCSDSLDGETVALSVSSGSFPSSLSGPISGFPDVGSDEFPGSVIGSSLSTGKSINLGLLLSDDIVLRNEEQRSICEQYMKIILLTEIRGERNGARERKQTTILHGDRGIFFQLTNPAVLCLLKLKQRIIRARIFVEKLRGERKRAGREREKEAKCGSV